MELLVIMIKKAFAPYSPWLAALALVFVSLGAADVGGGTLALAGPKGPAGGPPGATEDIEAVGAPCTPGQDTVGATPAADGKEEDCVKLCADGAGPHTRQCGDLGDD